MRGRVLRRAPRLVIALVVVALAFVAAAVAGLQPADLSFTPKSEAQMTNIDVARAYAKNYYGAPTAVAGTGMTATWNTPLNLESNYAEEARSQARARRDGTSRSGGHSQGGSRGCTTRPARGRAGARPRRRPA